MLTAIVLAGCKKYDDGYLNPALPKTVAYFASFLEYSRTVVVGEGLEFKIGPAMGGVLTNTKDRTVDLQIGAVLNKTTPADPRVLLPLAYYNSKDLSGAIRTTIPAGQVVGYFTVKLDSITFLNDPVSM